MAKKAGTGKTKPEEGKTKKSIGRILVTTLVPVTAVGIIIIIAFLSIQAKNTIVKLSKENLQAQTVENAEQIGNTITSVTSTIEEYANTLESIPLATHDDIYNYILPSHDIKTMNTSGIYIGFSDNSYIFTDGTTVDSDWLPTERDWYKEGINYDTLTATEPYLDVSTGYMCVTFCRKIDLANGENGVLAIDIYLDVLSDTIDELKPMGTGASFAIADNMVLAYPENKDLNGKDVSEGGDFTVEMPARTGDEIGLIRDELRSYVANMKSTISDIQKNAAKLHEDSASSKEASAAMSDQATEQSESMKNIKATMDDMASAVEELANNATKLAGSISDITEKGKSVNSTMLDLVDKADVGQKDMKAVSDSMGGITGSMSDMNDVVNIVGESAKKITEIVSMIDSIAQQTNLL